MWGEGWEGEEKKLPLVTLRHAPPNPPLGGS